MICFTITENKRPGLSTTIKDGFPVVQIGETGEVHLVPLSDHFQDLVKSMPEGAVDLMLRNPLVWLNWNPEREELELDKEQEKGKDCRAIIHVATDTQGELNYTAAGFEEKDIDGRIQHFHFQFPSPGVELLAIGGEENHMLIRMAPGASFRMLRPKASGKKWFWARVIWNGDELLFHPHFRRAAGAENAA